MNKLIPVIHMLSSAQVLENIYRVQSVMGSQAAVFLINHRHDAEELITCAAEMRHQFPDLWLGINPLGVEPSEALQYDLALDGLWLDPTLRPEWYHSRRFKGQVFGGLAFKYQQQPADLAVACGIAQAATDVACTSGPGTGQAANLDKVRRLKEYLGHHPLALASGVSSSNLKGYLPYVDYFLVASSITGPGELIWVDELQKLYQLL